ncbi:MAG: LysR family transcriptional regulator [Bacteroidetes bacterium]|jgi:molybdate transport system regulatory protein|nr:LysR family transcriptional regulator [Bacteroidota bacterium]MBT6687159.1 LysR family transcriptional regulator [Bacteroidota bacterium]MBT7142380.1 LysR family transcriptional regulator [Bacteroidota bacterium]MBT7490328.1 LysR family transcriptional regulator [Bacteroidota bacterium]
MAGSKGSKYYDVFLRYEIRLDLNDKNVINDKLFNLFKQIDIEGSLSLAAEKMEISYRKAWGDIKKAEELLGFSFVEKHRGGAKGGKSFLTEDGRNIVEAYFELINEFDNSLKKITKKFFNEVNK